MAEVKIIDMPEFKGSDLISVDVEAMAAMSRAVKRLYGVGKIFVSTNATSPADFIGGEWKKIGGGRVLVTAGFTNSRWDGDTEVREDSDAARAGEQGGAARHTHLTPVGFDSNNIYFLMADVSGEYRVPIFNSAVKYHQAGITVWKDLNNFTDSSVRVAYTRENTSYPPYYTVFMWERVR